MADWQVVAPRRKPTVATVRYAPPELTIDAYRALAKEVSPADERAVLQTWATNKMCYTADEHEWLIPFFRRHTSICLRLNHVAGKGCANDRCTYDHICVLCGEEGHGLFMPRACQLLARMNVPRGWRSVNEYMCFVFRTRHDDD